MKWLHPQPAYNRNWHVGLSLYSSLSPPVVICHWLFPSLLMLPLLSLSISVSRRRCGVGVAVVAGMLFVSGRFVVAASPSPAAPLRWLVLYASFVLSVHYLLGLPSTAHNGTTRHYPTAHPSTTRCHIIIIRFTVGFESVLLNVS